MWSTNSLWFEVAIVSIIYAVGNMVFGHFEERTPKFCRVGKYYPDSYHHLRDLRLSGKSNRHVFSCCFFDTAPLCARIFFAQEKGINGWTGEPKSKYYDFRHWDKNIFKDTEKS